MQSSQALHHFLVRQVLVRDPSAKVQDLPQGHRERPYVALRRVFALRRSYRLYPSNWDLIETNGFFRVQSVNLFDSVIELDKIAKVTNLILRTIGCLMHLFIGEFRDKNRKNL